MSHGSSDWGSMAPTVTVAGLADMAELAARLGSINTFDRKGITVWMDNFEDNIDKWGTTLVGAASSCALSSEQARTGGKSVKVLAGMGGGGMAAIWKYIPYPALSKLGLELSFLLKTECDEIKFGLRLRDGATAYYGTFKIDISALDLDIYIPPGDFVKVADLYAFETKDTYFVTMKMIFDFVNNKYGWVSFRSQLIDLSGYSLNSSASATAPSLRVFLEVKSTALADGIMYIDDVIITQNEP